MMNIDEDTYLDLTVVHTIKLCMHEELVSKGLIVQDENGNYSIVEEKYRELVEYIVENSSSPVTELDIGY
jgi:hypothetical protein